MPKQKKKQAEIVAMNAKELKVLKTEAMSNLETDIADTDFEILEAMTKLRGSRRRAVDFDRAGHTFLELGRGLLRQGEYLIGVASQMNAGKAV